MPTLRHHPSHALGSLRHRSFLLAALAAFSVTSGPVASAQIPPPVSGPGSPTDATVARLREAARTDQLAWERLAYLCDRIGPRLAGTAPFLRAVSWAESTFRA